MSPCLAPFNKALTTAAGVIDIRPTQTKRLYKRNMTNTYTCTRRPCARALQISTRVFCSTMKKYARRKSTSETPPPWGPIHYSFSVVKSKSITNGRAQYAMDGFISAPLRASPCYSSIFEPNSTRSSWRKSRHPRWISPIASTSCVPS